MEDNMGQVNTMIGEKLEIFRFDNPAHMPMRMLNIEYSDLNDWHNER